jgi:PIN domain nuclease of toxin-antitoxin system
LGDRACLSLGRTMKLPVLTTDQAWKSLHLGVQVHLIRS